MASVMTTLMTYFWRAPVLMGGREPTVLLKQVCLYSLLVYVLVYITVCYYMCVLIVYYITLYVTIYVCLCSILYTLYLLLCVSSYNTLYNFVIYIVCV